jgi:hypothetical protein
MMRFDAMHKPAKKFVGLFFDEQTNTALREWAIGQGFNLESNYAGESQPADQFDFHLTVFFTTSYHSTVPGEYFVEPFNVRAHSMQILGVDRQIPVLDIELTPKLESIRLSYENNGYKDAWPEWKTHVSVSYKYEGVPDLSAVQLPNFPMTINRIKISNQPDPDS